VLGIGPVLLDSGASALLSQLVADNLPMSQMTPGIAFLAMAYSAAVTALAANVAGAVAVVTPLAGEFATATGLPLKAAALAQVNGFSAPFFPYEALPLMVGLAMTGVAPARALRFAVPLAVISLLLLTPLNLVWWRLLGYIPG